MRQHYHQLQKLESKKSDRSSSDDRRRRRSKKEKPGKEMRSLAKDNKEWTYIKSDMIEKNRKKPGKSYDRDQSPEESESSKKHRKSRKQKRELKTDESSKKQENKMKHYENLPELESSTATKSSQYENLIKSSQYENLIKSSHYENLIKSSHYENLIKSPEYENLYDLSVAAEQDSKRAPQKSLESRRKAPPGGFYVPITKSSSTSVEESSKRQKEIDNTKPVYMPRSKYYRKTGEHDTLQFQRSSRRHNRKQKSPCRNHHHRHHDRSREKKKLSKHRRLSESKSSTTTVAQLNDDDKDDIMFYIGSKTASQAAKVLKPNEFRIYYQIPEKCSRIPYKLQLFLAYMSSQNKEVFHFPVICEKNARSGENMWSLQCIESATFPTLSALIKYHKTYAYMDPSTGKIDTFPVWKGAIIDDDNTFYEN